MLTVNYQLEEKEFKAYKISTMAKKEVAVGYVRTATKEQDGNSLIKQENEIVEYCKKNGLQLRQVFKDNGFSGMDTNCEGWLKLKEYLGDKSNWVNTLVIVDLDRVSRNIELTRKEVYDLKYHLKIEVRLLNHAGITYQQVQKVIAIDDLFEKPPKAKKTKKNKRKRV